MMGSDGQAARPRTARPFLPLKYAGFVRALLRWDCGALPAGNPWFLFPSHICMDGLTNEHSHVLLISLHFSSHFRVHACNKTHANIAE